jgi:hypothetical protein
MASLDFAFVISDARAPDMPIIYASDRFFAVTGYGPSEVCARVRVRVGALAATWVCCCHPPRRRQQSTHAPDTRHIGCAGVVSVQVIGRNCRFLQGPDTERRKVTRGGRGSPAAVARAGA